MSAESAIAAAPAKSGCKHLKSDGETACISHKFLNGQLWLRCAICGQQWNSSPTSQVIVLAGTRAEYVYVCKAFGDNPKAPMKLFDGTGQTAGKHFNECLIVGTFFLRENCYELLQLARARLTTNGNDVIKFYELPGYHISSWDTTGAPVLRDEKGDPCCVVCKKKCWETYKGGVCSTCQPQGTLMKPKPKLFKNHLGISKEEYEGYGFGLDSVPYQKAKPVSKPTPTLVRKQGDIWKLPKANAPFRSEQWAYQGSAKTPYVVTRYDDKRDGAVTEDGWACSCMSFTRNVPRTPCKHILNVMLKEGIGTVQKATAKLANVDDKKMAEFERWQREEAARKKDKQAVSGEAKLNLFGNTGRKFR